MMACDHCRVRAECLDSNLAYGVENDQLGLDKIVLGHHH